MHIYTYSTGSITNHSIKRDSSHNFSFKNEINLKNYQRFLPIIAIYYIYESYRDYRELTTTRKYIKHIHLWN
jgi:hypothetical protein